MLIELVSVLVMALGQNATNITPAIPLGILLAKAKGGEALPPQEGGDATAKEAELTLESQKVTEATREDRKPIPECCQTQRTRDSVFNKLEWPADNPNLDDGYDFEFEHSTSSRGSTDLRARLNARCT